MSNETYDIILQTIAEMKSVGLSKSFIKQEIPVMFDLNIQESFWDSIFNEATNEK